MIELLLQAERALSVGLLDRAETLYAQVARADPRNSIAVVGLARVTLDRGDDEAALELARKALAIDPENVAAERLVARLEEIIDYRVHDDEADLAVETTTVVEPEGGPERDATAQADVAAEPDGAAEPEAEVPPASDADVAAEPEGGAEPEPTVGVPTEPEVDAPAEPEVDAPAEPEVDAPAEPEVDAPASPEVEDAAEPETEITAEPEEAAEPEPSAGTPTDPGATVDPGHEGVTRPEVAPLDDTWEPPRTTSRSFLDRLFRRR
jgi:hypothetical protein